MNDEQPQLALVYGGGSAPNSGHAGTDTSRERAETDDASGVTATTQRDVVRMAKDAGPYGITVAEVRNTLDVHHGKASSALSNLHAAGHLDRLLLKRGRCRVYVTPDNVRGRDTDEQGSTSTHQLLMDCYVELKTVSPCMVHLSHDSDNHPDCRPCRVTTLIRRIENRGTRG